MFGKKIHLFTLFGFSVGIDFTWFLLAVLVAWSLASYLFPSYYKGYSTGVYWAMGVAAPWACSSRLSSMSFGTRWSHGVWACR